MKKNPVEALSIINPGSEKFFGLESKNYKTIGLLALAGICGFWIIKRIQTRGYGGAFINVQASPGNQGVQVSPKPLGWLILGALGVAGWYVWSQYKNIGEEKSRAESEEGIRGNPTKKTHRRYTRSSGSSGGYFVRVVGTNEVYPKPGSSNYPRGYSLRSAQNFARIGSQTGAARKVLRGSKNGPVVRKYEDGERVWPTTAAQARSLKPAERPSEFRKSA